MIGGIVRKLVPSGRFAIQANRDRARKSSLAGHGIRVAIAAGVLESATAHVVAVVLHGGVSILAEQAFRRGFDDERGGGDVSRLQASRPRNAVFDEARTGTVHL